MNLVVITSCLNPIKKNLSVDVCGERFEELFDNR